MASLIRGISTLASAAYAYAPSLATVAETSFRALEIMVPGATDITCLAVRAYQALPSRQTLKAVINPTQAADEAIKKSLQSFSLKKALEKPIPEKVIKEIGYFLAIYFEQLDLPNANSLIISIKKLMRKPLRIDEASYETLIQKYVAPLLTTENVQTVAASLFGTIGQIIHAVRETEKTTTGDKKAVLLKQLGIQTTFEEYKKETQKMISAELKPIIKNLADQIAEEKNPVLGLLIKIAALVLAQFTHIFSRQLNESLYRFALQHYLLFAANQNGDINAQFLGLDFKISKSEINGVYEKTKDYQEILFWYFLNQTATDLKKGKKQAAEVDQAWQNLVKELSPLLSQTIACAADHTKAVTWKGTAAKIAGRCLLPTVGVNVATNRLAAIQPSKLIQTTVKGLRKGFFSHKTAQ